MRIGLYPPHRYLLLLCCVVATASAALAPDCGAQSLEELKALPAYQKLSEDLPKVRPNPSKGALEASAYSNFGSLWKSSRSPSILLSWLQAKLPEYRYTETSVGLMPEHAGAQAFLVNKQSVRVQLDVLIPRSEYATMAQFNTLRSFNQFRPPALDVIAEQVLPIQGIDANYYRTSKGECSLLFKVERLGIVNLAVNKCADSKVMMDVAKQLNFARLNQKLLS